MRPTGTRCTAAGGKRCGRNRTLLDYALAVLSHRFMGNPTKELDGEHERLLGNSSRGRNIVCKPQPFIFADTSSHDDVLVVDVVDAFKALELPGARFEGELGKKPYPIPLLTRVDLACHLVFHSQVSVFVVGRVHERGVKDVLKKFL